MITVGSLFSGIGGLEYGLEQTGAFKTVWQSEIDGYASAVLRKHWPTVPNLGDITKVEWEKVERPDLICGGFPCQDISIAGKQKGIKEGTRSGLWFEFAKAIRALRPRYALIENVAMLANNGLSIVLADLAQAGYDAEWETIRASDVGANHRRERLFIIAYSNRERHIHGTLEIQPTETRFTAFREAEPSVHAADTYNRREQGSEVCTGRNTSKRSINASNPDLRGCGTGGDNRETGQIRETEVGKTSEVFPKWSERLSRVIKGTNFDTANSISTRRQRFFKRPIPQFEEFSWCKSIRSIEDLRNRSNIPKPFVRGKDDGLSNRMDRTKCIGNAVVPQVAQVIGEWIAEYEQQRLR